MSVSVFMHGSDKSRLHKHAAKINDGNATSAAKP